MYLSLAFAFIVHSCFPLARSLLHSHSHSPTLSFSLFLDRQLEWWRKTLRTLAHPPIYPILSLIPLYLWLRARVEIFSFGLSLTMLHFATREDFPIVSGRLFIEMKQEREIQHNYHRLARRTCVDNTWSDCDVNRSVARLRDERCPLKAPSERALRLVAYFSCLLRSTMDSRGRWPSSSSVLAFFLFLRILEFRC